MVRQLELLRDDTREQEFTEWVRANPHVVAAFRSLALEWFRSGKRRCSQKMLIEVLRWNTGIAEIGDPDGFKLNNNHTSRLARHILHTTPELPSDFFPLRTLKADRGQPDDDVFDDIAAA